MMRLRFTAILRVYVPLTAEFLLLSSIYVTKTVFSASLEFRLDFALPENHTPEFALRIRLKSLPEAGEFDEFNLSHFRVGSIVVVPSILASMLILSGHAELIDDHPARAEAADFGQPKFPARR